MHIKSFLLYNRNTICTYGKNVDEFRFEVFFNLLNYIKWSKNG